MTFVCTLQNGRTIRHTSADGCQDKDVIIYRLKRAGWKVVAAHPIGE